MALKVRPFLRKIQQENLSDTDANIAAAFGSLSAGLRRLPHAAKFLTGFYELRNKGMVGAVIGSKATWNESMGVPARSRPK